MGMILHIHLISQNQDLDQGPGQDQGLDLDLNLSHDPDPDLDLHLLKRGIVDLTPVLQISQQRRNGMIIMKKWKRMILNRILKITLKKRAKMIQIWIIMCLVMMKKRVEVGAKVEVRAEV